MIRAAWVLGWVCVGVWSLVCAVVYGALDLVGGLAARNADAFSSDPQTVERIFGLFRFLQDASTSVVLVAWGVVSLAILAVPWLIAKLDRASRTAPPVRTGRLRPSPEGPGAVIDLGPDQYTVGPAPGPAPRPGALPRIRSRS